MQPERYRPTSGARPPTSRTVLRRSSGSTIGHVSKRSITRKLARTSKRLTSLRDELGTIDEQARHLRDDADDMAVRAIVADDTGVSRDARHAREHADAHQRNRDRVVQEIAELEQRQDRLLDELSAAR